MYKRKNELILSRVAFKIMSTAHGESFKRISFRSQVYVCLAWLVMDQIPASMDRHLDVIQCHQGLCVNIIFSFDTAKTV